MMRHIYSLLLAFMPCLAMGQVLTGKVVDLNQSSIGAAQIFIKKKKIYTQTDDKGDFRLNGIKKGDTLAVRHIGYEDKDLIINDLEEDIVIQLEASFFDLENVVVVPSTDALNVVSSIDLQLNPVKSAQEILQTVPGLIIGQHAGGGKAEQIFLRGFDIDHGTDINITVDGLPVNMVSHAHGQGYADIHFLIPETVEKIDFGKGPYYADQGNFATAGYVNFQTKRHLNENEIKVELGQFNTFRTVGLLNIANTQQHSAYVASEYVMTDGFFESPQNFHRLNLLAKYTGTFDSNDRLSVLASFFDSQWDASGQIPQRAVEANQITRFGAIDDTEGGITGRTNFKLDYQKYLTDYSFIKNTVYYTQYDFELYSNFTFFLNDSINGDQIRQKEQRDILGVSTEWNYTPPNTNHLIQVGATLRHDKSYDNELSHTLNRETVLENMQLGDIDEMNIATYINTEWHFGNWIINPVLRLDYFRFNYDNALNNSEGAATVRQSIISPKLNIFYNHSLQLSSYLKLGRGFHANDARVVVAQNGNSVLPPAYSGDLGIIWKPQPKLLINAALWYLYLEQEFVYVGDEGIVEPSGETQRLGVDFGIQYQLMPWLFFNADVNYAHAQSLNTPTGENHIPLAPSLTSTGGINVRHADWYGSWRYRYVKDRAANEDYSITAKGYFITDLAIGYQWPRLDIGIVIENLFDTAWNETQFATTSRLLHEAHPIEEIHFTPGTPFFGKIQVAYKF